MESNPGPGWKEFTTIIEQQYGNAFPLDMLQKKIGKKVIDTKRIKTFLQDPNNTKDLLEMDIDADILTHLYKILDQLESGTIVAKSHFLLKHPFNLPF